MADSTATVGRRCDGVDAEQFILLCTFK